MPRPISPPRSASPSDPETGVRNMGTYRGAAEGDRPARRAHGVAPRRRRRLSALAEIPEARSSRCRAPSSSAARRSMFFTGPQKLADRHGRDGGRGRPRRRADPHRQVRRPIDLEVPADAEIVIEGPDRSRAARAGRPVRRKPRPCRARRLQHVDAGDRDHARRRRRSSSRSSAR